MQILVAKFIFITILLLSGQGCVSLSSLERYSLSYYYQGQMSKDLSTNWISRFETKIFQDGGELPQEEERTNPDD